MLSKIAPNLLIGTAITVLSLLPLVSNTANAGSRYGTPPPAVLSPNLTAPWVLQLRANPPQAQPGLANRYRVKITPPVSYQRAVYRPAVQTRVHKKPKKVFRRSFTRVYAPKPIVVSSPVIVKKTTRKNQLDARFEPQIVSYSSGKAAGTIVIDTNDKFLYLVMGNGQARRYGVGVGKPGFEWAGTHKITRKAQWPTWRPPVQMIAREKKKGRILPRVVEGGPQNPLGARALYLGSTLYRIHGTNSPWTIGKAVSSGCIRMRNEDVMDLYERVGVGTRVVVS